MVTEPELLEFLAQEYLHLQETVESFNDISFIIKGTSLSVTAALLGYCMKERRNFVLVLLTALVPVFALIMDAIWKSFQYGYYPRILKIEKVFAAHEPAPFQLTKPYLKNAGVNVELLENGGPLPWWNYPLMSSVYLPHVVVLGAVVVVAAFWLLFSRGQNQRVGD